MSHIRIQTVDETDLVTVSLEDGTVDVKDPSKLTDAARAFWDAVHTVRHQYTGYNDLVLKGTLDGTVGRGGDLRLIAGRGGSAESGPKDQTGGNVNVIGPAVLPQDGHGKGNPAVLEPDG